MLYTRKNPMYSVEFVKGVDSQFWNHNHPLSDKNSELYSKLVPSEGQADTMHGELLRMTNRFVYDVFNNGLCNDKLPEIIFIIKSFSKFEDYLNDKDAAEKLLFDFKQILIHGGIIKMATNVCETFDDIVAAIVMYVESKEGL